MEILHPQTGEVIRTIKVIPAENLTQYDDIPFLLEREIREILHHRYKVRVVAENADIHLRLQFRNFDRGELRQSSNLDRTQRIYANAELKLLNQESHSLQQSNQSLTELYGPEVANNFDEALQALITKLADNLVVDLLEP